MSHDDVGEMSMHESACVIVTSVMMSYGMISKQQVISLSQNESWGPGMCKVVSQMREK